MKYYDYNFGLGDRLKALRHRSGKTIEQVAEETGVDPRTVANWERGALPRVKHFHQHLDSLEVSDEERIELVQIAFGNRK